MLVKVRGVDLGYRSRPLGECCCPDSHDTCDTYETIVGQIQSLKYSHLKGRLPRVLRGAYYSFPFEAIVGCAAFK